jgi:hypothetical protein
VLECDVQDILGHRHFMHDFFRRAKM